MSDKPPEQKNGLLEMLKNLWLPAAGFVGAVTLAYNFYQSWLGDQAIVTYLSGGIGLLILLIALAWVGFKTNTIEIPTIYYLPDQKIASPRKEKRPAYPSLYKTARIALALVFVGMIAGGAVLYQRRQALQEKLVVLIATFEGPEEVYGLRNEIIEKLNADFPNDAEVEIVKIGDVITPDQGSPYARALGERYLADVVLWSWYRPTQNPNITIHIENLSPDQTLPIKTSETLQPTVTLAELESFSFQQESGQETSALISFLVGYLQFESKNYSQALVRFDDSLGKIPGDAVLLKNQAEIYYYRGATYYSLNQYDQAITDYSNAIEIEPENARYYIGRGFVYHIQMQWDKALADYSKSIHIEPHLVAYINRGDVYYSLKQYQEAIIDFSKAIQINAREAEPYNNLGCVYYSLDRYDEAIANFSKAIQIDPLDAGAYTNRGAAYTELKQYDQAMADYSKAIQINPQDANTYNNRGAAYYQLKQYDQAINDYSKAIQMDPQNAKTYYNRGKVYNDLDQYSQAITDYSKAIQVNPQYADAYDKRGYVYANQKQYEQAIVDYSKAIQLDPQNARIYINRGLAYSQRQQYNQALVDFSKAIEIDPKSAGSYLLRGLSYGMQMQWDKAVADFSKAIQISPHNNQAYYYRGLIYQELGKTAEAEADFAKYKELGGQGQP